MMLAKEGVVFSFSRKEPRKEISMKKVGSRREKLKEAVPTMPHHHHDWSYQSVGSSVSWLKLLASITPFAACFDAIEPVGTAVGADPKAAPPPAAHEAINTGSDEWSRMQPAATQLRTKSSLTYDDACS
jgi:hypothetical protein